MVDFVAVASFSVIVPLSVAVIAYKNLPVPGRYIAWLLAAWFVAELFSFLLRINGFTNWNVYFLLSFAEIIILAMFYKHLFISRRAKSVIVWIAWIGLAIVSAEYIISKSPDNSFTMLFESLFFFAMGLYALYEMTIEKASRNYSLIVICIMTFFLASGVYFSTWKFMKFDEDLFRLFGNAHAFLLLGCYAILSYSLWRLQL